MARDSHVMMEESKHEAFLKPHFPLFSGSPILFYFAISLCLLSIFLEIRLFHTVQAWLCAKCHELSYYATVTVNAITEDPDRCYTFYSFLFTFFCGLLLSRSLFMLLDYSFNSLLQLQIGKTMAVHICLLPFYLKIHMCLLRW